MEYRYLNDYPQNLNEAERRHALLNIVSGNRTVLKVSRILTDLDQFHIKDYLSE